MRKILVISIAILMVACGGKERPPKPDNLISKDQMSNILYDVFLLNSAKGINKKVLENNGIFPQEYVYKKYNIDSLRFAKSNEYYAYDVETYEGIIQNVKQRIEAEKTKYEAISSEEDEVKDSINEATAKKIVPDTISQQLKMKIKDSLRRLGEIE